MRLLVVTGARALVDRVRWVGDVLYRHLAAWRPDELWCGDAIGVDATAAMIAQWEEISVVAYALDGTYGTPLPVTWPDDRLRVTTQGSRRWWEGPAQYGKHWPPIRNKALVLDACAAQAAGAEVRCLSLYGTPERTGGTAHTEGLARRGGLPVLAEHYGMGPHVAAGTEKQR